MKFDLDTAWKDTTALLRDNFRLLALIAGVFYFVPYAAILLWVPGLSEFMNGAIDPNSSAAQAKLSAMLSGYWWAFLLGAIIQGIGFLAMLSLLRRRASPTVGQAIQNGARAIPSYLATSIIMGVAIALAVIAIAFLFALTGIGALQVLAIGLGIAIAFYLVTKFSMAAPIIAIDEVLNPIEAMRRSWNLTGKNSFRLFGFYALLFVAYAIISMLVSMVFSLVFALGGAETQLFGQAITSSLMNALAAMLFASVLAAVHAQLSRLRAPRAEPVDGRY